MVIRDDRGLTEEITIEGVDYEVTFNVWDWISNDGKEPDEHLIEITDTVPDLDIDSDEFNQILDILYDKYQ